MDPTVLLIVLLALSIVIAFGIGANDEAMAPMVGTGAMKLKWVLIMGFAINIVGAVLLGGAVSETIGVGLLDVVTIGAQIENLILAVIISTSIFLILSSTKGL
ncbi:MAG: inorganic phosphate transporter, partial [Candidatus Helarchaeota archaeon]|nr:inorganic phosphate transporter [Candidatus Helarchaeota archaeon]